MQINLGVTLNKYLIENTSTTQLSSTTTIHIKQINT